MPETLLIICVTINIRWHSLPSAKGIKDMGSQEFRKSGEEIPIWIYCILDRASDGIFVPEQNIPQIKKENSGTLKDKA